METNREIKEQAGQVFMNADYKFKLFNQAHPDWQTSLPKEPHFSDLYQPTVMQRQGKEVKVPGETTKQWLIRQTIWQVYLPAPRYIPRPKFDVSTPISVHQADHLFETTL